MGFEKKSPRWRQWLTPEELAQVAEIDAEIDRAKIRSLERARIANRAVQRIRYNERQRA